MPSRVPSRAWTLVLGAVGGVLTDQAFPDRNVWGLAFVGIAMLMLALRRDSARWNSLVGLLWGLGFYLPQLTWITSVVGPVPWVLLAILEGGFVALFAAAWSWARRGAVIWRSPVLQATGFAVVWVGVEELRSVIPFGGFPWGRLAFSQGDALVARLAWLGGVPLVSGVVALVGALLALAVLAARRIEVGRALGALAAGTALLLIGLVVPLDSRAESGTLEIGAVQGNVDMNQQDLYLRQRGTVVSHAAGTRALLDTVRRGDLDLVLWPENVTSTDLREDAESAAVVDGAAMAIGAPILLGTVEYPTTGGRYNLSVLWKPGKGIVDTYAKQVPAPFAEYIPMRSLARRIAPEADEVTTDMLAAHEPGLIQLDSPRLGRTVGIADVICFEVAYDWVVREAVAAGGEMLVVQTNNVTFGHSDEAVQQLAMSRLRAIETGRTTVQISTVGVSAVIAPNGAVGRVTGLFTADQLTAHVPLRTSITPAVRWGQQIVWAFSGLAVTIVLAGAAGARRLRRKDRGDMLG